MSAPNQPMIRLMGQVRVILVLGSIVATLWAATQANSRAGDPGQEYLPARDLPIAYQQEISSDQQQQQQEDISPFMPFATIHAELERELLEPE